MSKTSKSTQTIRRKVKMNASFTFIQLTAKPLHLVVLEQKVETDNNVNTGRKSLITPAAKSDELYTSQKDIHSDDSEGDFEDDRR